MTATARSPHAFPRELANPLGYAFSPTAPIVYISSVYNGRETPKVAVYRFDPQSGEVQLQSIHELALERTASAMVVNAAGTYLYVAMRNTFSGAPPPPVHAFRIDAATGSLTEAASLNVPARMAVSHSELAISSDGKLLFVTHAPPPVAVETTRRGPSAAATSLLRPAATLELSVLRVDGASMTLAGASHAVGTDPHTLHVFETQPER